MRLCTARRLPLGIVHSFSFDRSRSFSDDRAHRHFVPQATPNIGGVFASVHGSKRAPSPTPFNKGGIFGPLTRPQRTVSMPADRQQRGLGDMRHSKDVFTVGALGDNGDEDGKENIEPDGCAPPQPAVDASGVLQEITCSMQNRVSVASDDVFARAKSPHAGALMSPKSPGALSNDDRPETGSAISAQGDGEPLVDVPVCVRDPLSV